MLKQGTIYQSFRPTAHLQPICIPPSISDISVPSSITLGRPLPKSIVQYTFTCGLRERACYPELWWIPERDLGDVGCDQVHV